MDRITIRDLSLSAVIGVREKERRRKQRIVANLELLTDFREAVESDDLSKTVDYSEISRRIQSRVASSRYRLLESLAESIAVTCLEYPRVRQVTVTLLKPKALATAQAAEVTVIREREER